MVTRVVGEALVHAEMDARWSVTSIEYPQGLARLERRAGLTRVVVGDTEDTEPDRPVAYSALACTPDGDVVIVARRSPPAIVLGRSGVRTAPADGAQHECQHPAAGDRLLLLSCAAFENMSQALAADIGRASRSLRHEHPQTLLLAIFQDFGRGAGAVVDRLPGSVGHLRHAPPLAG